MKKLNRTSILLFLLLFFFFFFSFSFSFSSTFVASGDNTITLYNATDLIELSNDVADGTSYAGTTILLGADLDFSGSLSEEFNPIGKDYIIEFKGSFDGQGHVISNLAINSSEQFVGLFGCTNATDIRNVVLDASCSVLNNYVSEPNVAYTGGIIGYANPLEKSNSNAVVEGCVNMASVTFAGNTMGNDSSIITVGGIVSFFLPDYYNMVIKNCINYGMIVYSGASSLTSIGGITGAFFNPQTSSDNMCIINNCANYGSFIHNGTTARIYTIGGIIGTAVHSIIENCLSLGTVTTTEESAAIGMIIGALNGYTTIKHCFWVAKENITNSYGYKLITDPTVTDSYLVELNETTLNLLNDWAGSNRSAYRDWMTLYLKGGSFGSTDNEIAIVIKTAFPDPTKEGHNFDGWCTDDNCTDGVYRGDLNGTITALYAHWTINNYTISFDYMNGTIIEMCFRFNDTILYPEVVVEEGKVFDGWSNSLERMPGYNLTVMAIFRNVTDNDDDRKNSNAGVISGGIVGGFTLIALAVLIILFVILKKSKGRKGRSYNEEYALIMNEMEGRDGTGDRKRDGRQMRLAGEDYVIGERRPDATTEDEGGQYIPPVIMSVPMETLYPEYYHVPTMKGALVEAGISTDKADLITEAAEQAGRNAASNGKLFDGFTEADAAAIAMYTYDFGAEDSESNPYTMVNKALSGEGNPESIRGLLYLLMTALRKLPKYQGHMLYRGVRESVQKSVYQKGSVVMWPAPTSTSPDMKATKWYMTYGKDENNGNGMGTLFVIEGGWGYNIQPYSLYPDEEEILLEPERRFQVQSVIGSETTVINLRMLDTPLTFPQFFGEVID